jgi:hypothetical protein
MATNTPDFNWPIPEDTDLVKDGAEAIRDLALAIEGTVMAFGQKRIEAFTASGTWTVPAGVTYAIAHMLGGGGGVGRTDSGSDGGDSSVAFASGTVIAPGQLRAPFASSTSAAAKQGAANSGASAIMQAATSGTSTSGASTSGPIIVAGADVTPAASITVTVGAGGAAGTNGAAGGSGYVYIEYYE